MTQEPWLSGETPPPTTAAPSRSRGILLTVLIAAVVAFVVGGFAGIAGFALGRAMERSQAQADRGPQAVAPAGDAVRASGGPIEDVSSIAAATLPAVVSIVAEGGTQEGSGSGFIIREDGYLLTNNHVVDLVSGGGTLTVVFNDGGRAEGTVVGTSPSYDLAVVKVSRTGLPTVSLGDSSAVHVGDLAIAIGAPLGLDGTVTSGIVSALDRPVTAGDQADVSYINAIQTDAAINPGNSGGPLLDMHGRVIGVNSAIASMAMGSEAGSIGLGFAIPSNSAKRISDEIIATGSSRTPLMGVQLDAEYTGRGARVGEITRGSGAEDAGLKAGDIIVKVDDRVIDDATELVVTVRDYAPGATITVAFQRDGQDRTATLVLGDGGQ